MNQYIKKIIDLSSEQFIEDNASNFELIENLPKDKDFLSLLKMKNGFYLFNSTLRFFSTDQCEHSYGLKNWNSDSLWRKYYGTLTEKAFFFAENFLGEQFCFLGGEIFIFNPEDGRMFFMAKTFTEWCRLIVDQYEKYSAHELGRSWQLIHGPISGLTTLVPKKLFILGGGFDVDNLVLLDSVVAMRVLGPIALHLNNLPDGAKVSIEVVDWLPVSGLEK